MELILPILLWVRNRDDPQISNLTKPRRMGEVAEPLRVDGCKKKRERFDGCGKRQASKKLFI